MVSTTKNNSYTLTNGRIIFRNRILDQYALIVSGEKISGIVRYDDLPDIPKIDCCGNLICPGLIDVHTHGCNGFLFSSGNESEIENILGEYRKRGVTSILATFASEKMDTFLQQAERFKKFIGAAPGFPEIIGIYYESQYIDMDQRGALNPDYIKSPVDEDCKRFEPILPFLKIFMLAPEKEGSEEIIRYFRENGVRVAVGHTAVKETELRKAILSGVTQITHIWRNMPLIYRDSPWVIPGVPEVSQFYDPVYVEVVGDNNHVQPTMIEYSYRVFGSDRMLLVTDSTQAAGLPDGSIYGIAGNEFVVKNGVGWRKDMKAFAGSAVMLNDVLRITAKNTQIPITDIIKMATYTPACAMNIEKNKGSLEVGKNADIVVFDDEFNAQKVFVRGTLVVG
ncbi:MAG: N-acetylglucosamine-6-phosphate deacetylase [Flexilinea sp.]